jgi:hypothetical protein
LLASKLLSSIFSICRCLDSRAVLSCVVRSISSFNACCRLSTCKFESAADCNCSACSLASFNSPCSLFMCSSHLSNAVTLSSYSFLNCSVFPLSTLLLSSLTSVAFNFFSNFSFSSIKVLLLLLRFTCFRRASVCNMATNYAVNSRCFP